MNKVITKISVSIVIPAIFACIIPAVASAAIVYDAVPNKLDPNYTSQPFQAQQTSEFGDYVHLAGTARNLTKITMTMSNWALYSEYSSDQRYSGNQATWTHPITVNVYSNHLSANGTPDQVLASKTVDITIPWRPVGDPSCKAYAGVYGWRADDGSCYTGIAFNATFDLKDLHVTLPDDVIIGFVYNTESYGPTPIGMSGPYNSLNIAIPAKNKVRIGSDDSTVKVFWNTSTASYYTNPACTGGTFCEDIDWGRYGTVAIQINATEAVSGPTSVKQCKDDGWKSYTNPSFKNQGACVKYVQENQ